MQFLEIPVAITSSGDNSLGIPVAEDKTLTVWGWFLVAGANMQVTFKDSAGNALTGAMDMSQYGAQTFEPAAQPWMTLLRGKSLVINTSAVGRLSGRLFYQVT